MRNSYGYRPNKSAHQAVHSLTLNLQFKGYGYIVEADIKGFFDNLDHEWLNATCSKQRIDDKAILNLINQWLKARIKSPDGVFHQSHRVVAHKAESLALFWQIFIYIMR